MKVIYTYDIKIILSFDLVTSTKPFIFTWFSLSFSLSLSLFLFLVNASSVNVKDDEGNILNIVFNCACYISVSYNYFSPFCSYFPSLLKFPEPI